jgi:hypothetical protein
MKLGWKTTAVVAGLLLITRGTALAVVFDEKSPEQKLRADVGKQVAGYMKCLGSALLACEKTGATGARECTLETGVALAPADPKGKFAAQIAKCEAKLDYDRKGPRGNSSLQNYELIGCPSYGSGLQFADMAQFQSFLPLIKPAVDDLFGSLPFISGCSDAKSCYFAQKLMLDLLNGLNKCELACENDYKDTKGNGGPTDDVFQCDVVGGLDAGQCLEKAADRFRDRTPTWPFGPLVASTLTGLVDDLNDDLFNAAPSCD